MTSSESALALAHAIQLSAAPAFLFSGVAGFLNVLASRLARVVDRAHGLLAEGSPQRKNIATRERREFKLQKLRIQLLSLAIGCCTFAALLVAAVVINLFADASKQLPLGAAVSPLFMVAMGALMLGLVLFLVDIGLSTSSLRQRF
ncbi:MAG: DUF2721 domain-containing protein [Synechococcus lacustris]|jgi:hypothetical protein